MFLRRLGGWLPRPWGRKKSTKTDLPAPEPRWVDSSPENSGSDWDSAPETMGDVRPLKTKDSGKLRTPGAALESSREVQVDQLRSKGNDSFRRDKTVSSIQEPTRLEARGAIPKPEWDSVDSGGIKDPGVLPQGGLGTTGPETLSEKPGRRQKLLRWLRGDPGAPAHYLQDPEEYLQISTNLTLHLLELLASALLALCSRPLRAVLDALGLRGPVGLWLHGLLCFLAALHGLHAVLTLLTAHPLHFACLFGLLQALVLAVSLREPVEDDETTDWESERQGKEAKEPREGPGRVL
ncbi:DNA segment, Chr 17, D6S53E [Sigmodon hispidus]